MTSDFDMICYCVQSDFRELVEEEGWTVTEAVSKIIEDYNKQITQTPFHLYVYFIQMGIESLKREGIADFVYEKLAVVEQMVRTIEDKEIDKLLQDVAVYLQLLKTTKYTLIETSFSNKSRVAYMLNLS